MPEDWLGFDLDCSVVPPYSFNGRVSFLDVKATESSLLFATTAVNPPYDLVLLPFPAMNLSVFPFWMMGGSIWILF